jgi:Na+-transporting methylmalonyl-CoA/oxaloacetate decarboxylase gamma subunit
MAIQFQCPGCSQPIEVDDIYAGQTAACPYCRRVVSVPTESSLGEPPVTAARPTNGSGEAGGWAAGESPESGEGGAPPPLPPRPIPGELHVGPSLTPREHAARTLGTYALVCTAIVFLLFVAMIVYGVSQVASDFLGNPGSQPSPERMAEIQKQFASDRWVGAADIGMAFFALVGVVLAIVSLVQGRRSNWRAVLSLVICGLVVLCVCGGTVTSILAGGGITPA